MLKPLRRVVASLAAMVHSRIELASVELSESVERAIVNLVLAFVGLLLISAALLAASVWVVLLAGEAQRTTVLAVMVVVYLCGGLLLLQSVRNRVRAAPPLLAATMAELQQDARTLSKES